MYERRKQRLLSRFEFGKRVGRHGLMALGVLVFGLGIGVAGYHWLAHLNWINSLLNASMILGGMGPVDPLPTNAAKLFASFFALFSGLAFIGIASVLLAPFVHRSCTAFTRRTVTRWIFCVDLRKSSFVLGRIEAFRDGIFAIVVTLLVVDLRTHVNDGGSDHL